MNNAHFEKKLRDKERELLADLARFKDEARMEGEVKDTTDDATSDQNSAETLQQAAMESETLQQVRDALQRIANGTYGKCIRCGRAIEPARLEAIPWTPYCLEDQEKADQQAA
jgi:DnaK suppressor protein